MYLLIVNHTSTEGQGYIYGRVQQEKEILDFSSNDREYVFVDQGAQKEFPWKSSGKPGEQSFLENS